MLVIQHKIVSVEYFMDKMQDWEIYDIYELLNQCNVDEWEQTRLLMYVTQMSNSHKKINKSIQEWFPLPWDQNYNKKALKKTISNEEIKSMSEKAKAIQQKLFGKK